MAEEEKPQITIANVCGPSSRQCKCQCPDGPCEHQWNGPIRESKDGTLVSATCSRCGMSAYEHDIWILP